MESPIYQQYLDLLAIDPGTITEVQQVPFLPIDFFKHHIIKTNDWQEEKVFESSGTTGAIPSRHYISSLAAYHQNAREIFEKQFGEIKAKLLLALLPSYLERDSSSLVSMVDHFIRLSDNPRSGFYLNDHLKLVKLLTEPTGNEQVFLFGVSFALLDLAEKYELDLSHVTIIETGGMKGRREEMVKGGIICYLR